MLSAERSGRKIMIRLLLATKTRVRIAD